MSEKVRVAIIGVGNCASSLVQGVQYYQHASDEEFVPGLMHVNLGGYHIRDVEFSAAFDVDSRKVDRDLSEAIFIEPNNTVQFADVPRLGVSVSRGMTHDGLGKYLRRKIAKAPGQTAAIKDILQDTGTDVVINFLPVGSEMATKWYVEQVIDAVRLCKIAMDRGVSGTLEGPSAYLMKSPPVQHPDDVAREMTEAFVRGE